jgi:hypothetical protein
MSRLVRRAENLIQIKDRMARLMLPMARCAAMVLAALLGTVTASAHAAGNEAMAATLRKAESYSNDSVGLENGFGRALWLESEDADGTAKGTVEAVLDFPFESASAQLSQPANWCDILILHFNVKSCAVDRRGAETVLDVEIGRKYERSAGKVYRVRFVFSIVQQRDELLHVQLVGEEGPLSTRNYRIVVLASPLEDGKFVVRLSYAYDYGMLGKLAMEAYLGTLGRNKVGFTIEGEDSNGQPRYIRGMRGAVERNAMRYCLAVESYMRSLSRPRQEQIEARLQDWFTSSQHFSRQLYEMDRDRYLAIKRDEISGQQAATTTGGGG